MGGLKGRLNFLKSLFENDRRTGRFPLAKRLAASGREVLEFWILSRGGFGYQLQSRLKFRKTLIRTKFCLILWKREERKCVDERWSWWRKPLCW